MTRCILLALAITCVASAAPLPVRAADDKDLLKGAWTAVKAEQDGKPVTEVLKAKLTFKDGDKLLIKLTDETKARETTVKLDAAKKPKQIDITRTEDGKSETALGIYELDGDKLKLCVAEPEVKERPAEFKSTSRKITYLELTRDKK